MTILVCPLSRVSGMIDAHRPERIVSMLDPGFAFPEAGPVYARRHLRLRFHDVHTAEEGHILPSSRHVNEILAFLGAWERTAPILIHCRAGIGRSTATAYIAACLFNPFTTEQAIAVALRRTAPFARPNETLVRLADRAMKRKGRMADAIADTGRNLPPLYVSEGEPFEMPLAYPAQP